MKRVVIIFFLFLSLLITAFSDEGFHFAVLGDRLGGADDIAFERVLKEIEGLKPDMVMSVGDLRESYNGEDYLQKDNLKFQEYLKILSMDFYPIPGNHDISQEIYRDNFKSDFDRNRYYSFDYKNAHFIIIDNSTIERFEDMDKEQKKWIENDLKNNSSKENIFVFMHKPFWANGIGEGKPDEMHELFKKYNVNAVFTGHWHQYACDTFDGITYVLVGSSGGSFGHDNKENISMGMFYQFLWCKVEEDKLYFSLIKSGNIFDKNLVSIKEELQSYEIETNHIKIGFPYIENQKNNKREAVLTIKNINDYPLKTSVKWNSEKNWTITPKEHNIELKPKQEKSFKYIMTNTGKFYPLPEISFIYPFSEDKHIDFASIPIAMKKYIVPEVKKSININGKFDSNDEWPGNPIISFSNYYGEAPEIDKTEVYICKDEDYLYLGVMCFEKEMGKIVESCNTNDEQVYNDDCIGMLIEYDKDKIYQFYINPKGVIWDQLIEKSSGIGDVEFDINIKSSVKKYNDKWVVELQIPLKEINAENSKNLRVNIRRKQQRTGDGVIWSTNWNYFTDGYGELIFK